MRSWNSLSVASAVLLMRILQVRADNTTCASNALDWYTSSNGETPCKTYQRLRQTCNSGYTVGKFQPLTPGDVCDDQLKPCCCNSIAWALSMLCMNCQQDTSSTGIDAGKTAYQIYLNQCGPGTNQTLPKDVLSAACSHNIPMPSYLSSLFWVDGSWFYEYTKETAQLAISAGTNSSQICPSETVATTNPASNASTPTPTAATSQPTKAGATSAADGADPTGSAGAPTSHSIAGPVAGGVAGGVVALVAVALLVWWLMRRRRQRSSHVDLLEDKGMEPQDGEAGPHPEPYYIPAHLPASELSSDAAETDSQSNTTTAVGKYPGGLVQPPPGSKAALVHAEQQRSFYNPAPTLSTSSGPSSEPGHSSDAPLSRQHGPSSGDVYDSEYHTDAGVVLGRSASGRLPPAYDKIQSGARGER